MNSFIKIHPLDNVAVALTELTAGQVLELEDQQVTLQQDIPKGHKFSLQVIPAGANVIKYGHPIGHLLVDIEPGCWVHQDNLKTNLQDLNEYRYTPELGDIAQSLGDREINIYRRKDGRPGIRNELWIIPTVGCVNAVAQQMKRAVERSMDLSAIDGIHVLSHPYGCSQLGEDHENTRVILQNLVTHPNAGGVLVVGLGCENNQVSRFQQTLQDYDPERVDFMVCQTHEDEVEDGFQRLVKLVERMQQDKREPGKLSELSFGLECGGSDGFSGITANPLLGRFSDYVTAHGGTSVLTEVPEMFGAEHLLMAKCADENVFAKTVSMVNDFKQYYIDHQQPVYENPSPGNKAGGISTLEEKSLGCTQKAGSSTVMDVLKYGEKLHRPGLNLLSAPGNDAVATTALAAAGCHMVLFTTGRGTPYGGPVPTVKIATNSALANKKKHWIDFNAGTLLEGAVMDELLAEFVALIVDIANGGQTCNERNEFQEIAIFKSGVTL
ncbi:UxaA family hydrolase [Gynuella sunshinyii]|uniref:Altronate dehydratase n=1 Tax=Gynuella sunshinyii YC6258 TaxID=1445510 RepID=A0A0C5VN86_9GAMM|nr:altronate dehydratase family protein [Gynuella sunshinyii]AJQ94818.1 altronate dehydratase [Gynuella sunshinyii YC6258]